MVSSFFPSYFFFHLQCKYSLDMNNDDVLHLSQSTSNARLNRSTTTCSNVFFRYFFFIFLFMLQTGLSIHRSLSLSRSLCFIPYIINQNHDQVWESKSELKTFFLWCMHKVHIHVSKNVLFVVIMWILRVWRNWMEHEWKRRLLFLFIRALCSTYMLKCVVNAYEWTHLRFVLLYLLSYAGNFSLFRL